MNSTSKRNNRGTIWLILPAFWAGCVIYVLSIGPMYWACTNSRHEIVGPHGKAFVIIYQPVIRLYQSGPRPVHDLIGRYLELFER